MAKIYVVTLYSGENELEACVASVASQQGVDVVHEIIRDLPNQAAHQELYKRFDQRRNEFDFLAKLDADMAFSSPTALEEIIELFTPGVDVVSATVWDGITNSDMQSFNVFSCRCHFDFAHNDPLFPDKLPIHYPGRHVSFVDTSRRVHHAFDPSDYQAFCFGVHRSLKIMQFAERIPRIDNSYHQWRFVRRAYTNFSKSGSRSAYFASLGAAAVLRGDVADAHLKSKADYSRVFEASCVAGDLRPLSRLAAQGAVLPLLRIFGVWTVLIALQHYLRRKALARIGEWRSQSSAN